MWTRGTTYSFWFLEQGLFEYLLDRKEVGRRSWRSRCASAGARAGWRPPPRSTPTRSPPRAPSSTTTTRCRRPSAQPVTLPSAHSPAATKRHHHDRQCSPSRRLPVRLVERSGSSSHSANQHSTASTAGKIKRKVWLGVMPLRGQYWSIIMTAGSDALQYASAELQADVEVVRAAQAQVLTCPWGRRTRSGRLDGRNGEEGWLAAGSSTLLVKLQPILA